MPGERPVGDKGGGSGDAVFVVVAWGAVGRALNPDSVSIPPLRSGRRAGGAELERSSPPGRGDGEAAGRG